MKLLALQCCPLLLKAETLQSNSHSMSQPNAFQACQRLGSLSQMFVPQAVLQCPNGPTRQCCLPLLQENPQKKITLVICLEESSIQNLPKMQRSKISLSVIVTNVEFNSLRPQQTNSKAAKTCLKQQSPPKAWKLVIS